MIFHVLEYGALILRFLEIEEFTRHFVVFSVFGGVRFGSCHSLLLRLLRAMLLLLLLQWHMVFMSRVMPDLIPGECKSSIEAFLGLQLVSRHLLLPWNPHL